MKLPIALSNKHVHLSQADVDVLFGEGYQLTPFKPLSQPGQFACEEKVTVVGPKGQQTMRVLGPVRPESQVEVSLADARGLGLSVPVRQSGDIDGTPAFKLVGPKGEVECEKGIIVAARHIHMSLEDAEKFWQHQFFDMSEEGILYCYFPGWKVLESYNKVKSIITNPEILESFNEDRDLFIFLCYLK